MPAQIVPLLGTQTVSSGRNIINNNFTYLDLNKLGAFGITTPNVINCTASAGVIKECGTLSVLNGHLTIEGVTSTGATGTGQFVFHTSPTFAGTLTALHGTFTGNLTGLGTLNSEKSVSACGVVGDKSTDDTTALNSCISGMPDYSTLIIPLGYQIKVTTSVIIHGKHGIKIKAMTSSNGGPTTASGVPAIFWYGADGGTVIDIDDVGDSLFEGFSVYTSSGFTTGTAGASVAINVDQTTGLGVTTTNDIFDRIGIYGTQQRSSFVGIRFSNVSTSNVEHMAVRNSTIFCSYSTDQNSAVGKGITIGASANALGHNYEWTSINQCAVAIDTGSGGVAHITKNQLNSNGIHITGNSTQSLDISDNDSENTNQFFKGSGYNLRFSSNRMASCTPPSVTGCVQLTNGRVALFENNSFTAGAYYGVSSDGGGGITMMSRGNAYPDVTNTLAGWATFNGLVTTQHDICGGTLCTSELASAGNAFATAPTPRAGVGLIHYEQTTGRWRVSGNGAAFTDIPSTAAAVYGLFSGTHDATTCTAGDGTMQPCGGAPGNLTRTLPVSTVTNNAVDIGTFYGVTSFYGLANYSISISAGSPINVAKIYQVAISGDGANVWRKVLP